MNAQLNAAQDAMIHWLSHPCELGVPPRAITFVNDFSYQGLRYYIFRFQKNDSDDWFVGVAGGFIGDELTHWGHVLSEYEPYAENTDLQYHCISVIDRIMAYWQSRMKGVF